jgi:ribosomal protein S16
VSVTLAILPLVGDVGEFDPHAAAVREIRIAPALNRRGSWILMGAQLSRPVPQP